MMKKIVQRGLIGFPIGVCIGYAITIVISLIWAGGDYAPVVPAMAEMCASEINAVMLQFGLCGLLGAVYGCSSVIWENDRLSLLAQSTIHFVVVVGTMLPVAYICHWMEHSIAGVLQYLVVFAFIYMGMWLGSYMGCKRKIDSINRSIKE